MAHSKIMFGTLSDKSPLRIYFWLNQWIFVVKISYCDQNILEIHYVKAFIKQFLKIPVGSKKGKG